ncbi:MAG: peptidylprolyl isomerase [Ignavibacteriaceae bacterium]
MRSLTPIFIIATGAFFALFMIVSNSDIMEVFGARSNNVGSINGKEISYQEFTKAIDTQKENQKTQTGKDVSDDNMDQFRDQVWDAVVTQTLLEQQIKKMGITVTDQEIRDVILSDNPPQFLKQNFVDSTGKFNKQLYLNAIFDPKNAKPLLQAEDYIRQTLLNQKLQSMLLASVTVSEAEVKREFINQNTKINAQYAFIGIDQIPDSVIKVTDDDLKNYYNNNLDKFQIKSQRKLKYVIFRNTASAEDSATIKSTLESIMSDLKSDTTSFETMVNTYSSIPYSKDTLALNAFPPEADSQLLNAKPGSIIGPLATNTGYVLYHLLGSVPSNQPLVRASHILISGGNDKQNYDDAMKVYNELKAGADFAKVAQQVSKDPGSARVGGDLGWFGKGQMVPEFDKAAFSGKIGEIQKPIKTNFGYHIIKVTGKSDKKYVVEKLVNPIEPSVSTKDNNLSAAKDFSYLSNKDGFEKEVQLMNYQVLETPPFTKDAYSIPGIGTNKNLLDFAFKNSLNSISDPYRTQEGYVVAKISDVINEGVKSFDEVKAYVKSMVIREKKFEIAQKEAASIKNKIGGDLTKATSIDPKVVVNQTGQYTPNTPAPSISFEYNFIAKTKTLNLNTVSDPVKGSRGYYLIDVLERTPFNSSAYAIQKSTIRQNLLQAKRNIFLSEWIANLKKNADIVDHRQLFFNQ